MVESATWQFKEIPNEAKQKPMQRLEANQMLNRARKNYGLCPELCKLLLYEHKEF